MEIILIKMHLNKKKITKIIYFIFHPIKLINFLFYDQELEIKRNESLLSKLGCDIEKARSRLSKKGLEYKSKKLSWHYHFFAGLELDNYKILEIGTYDGKFSNFLSKTFVNSEIFTLDLKSDDEKFINSYDRKDEKKRLEFITTREKNLDRKNIRFFENDSVEICNLFKKNFFDIIWIDGDHHAPQVNLDISNSIKLVKKNGIICCDDIISQDYKDKKVSNESYKYLEKLNKDKLIENFFFSKIINKNNNFLHKYISVSKII